MDRQHQCQSELSFEPLVGAASFDALKAKNFLFTSRLFFIERKI